MSKTAMAYRRDLQAIWEYADKNNLGTIRRMAREALDGGAPEVPKTGNAVKAETAAIDLSDATIIKLAVAIETVRQHKITDDEGIYGIAHQGEIDAGKALAILGRS